MCYDLLVDALKALLLLNGLGIYHRDIKPDNIIIQKYESGDSNDISRLVIIDFGISRQWIQHVT